MDVAKPGLDTIEEFEGWKKKLKDGRFTAYLDKLPRKALWSPGYRGLWTIGPGLTGPEITKGTTKTREELYSMFRAKLSGHVASLNAKAKAAGVKLDQNQFDALISASWNLGQESTLISRVLEHLKHDDEDAAAKVFLEYDHAGGKKVRGLTRRRNAEMELFKKYTPAQLVQYTPQLSLMSKVSKGVVASGVGTYLTWDNFLSVRQVVPENTGMILLVVGIGLFALYQYAKSQTVKDHNEGRYIPA